MSNIVFAGEKHSFRIRENNVIGGFDEDWGSNFFFADISYLRSFSKKFHLGAGAGLGVSNPVRYYSAWKLNVEKTESSIIFPLFITSKYNFTSKPTSMFVSGDIGYLKGFAASYDDKGTFNPFGIFFQPTIGVDIGLRELQKLSFGMGFQVQQTHYQIINQTYDRTLDYYIYGFENESSSMPTIVFNVSFTF